MADIVTGTVTGQLDTSDLVRDHADIRREQESIGSDIRRELAQEACKVNDSVKTAGWHNSDRTGHEADRIVNQATQFYISEQARSADTAAAVAALKSSSDMSFAATQSAIQLAAERGATAAALATAATQMLVVQEAVKGREMQERNLIDNLRADLERERSGHRHWESSFYQAQSANLSSQLQAFQSQFQNATQGTVNFGSMTGNAGRNTSTNNVA